MNLLQIRFRHMTNLDSREKAVIESMVKNNPKFKDFRGNVEQRVYTAKGKIITHTFPIEGFPFQEFRKSIKKAGLIGKKFDFDKKKKVVKKK